MRILQVTPCFYPAWAYGGPVPVAYHLSKELAKRGHEVVVYTTDTIDQRTRQKTRHLEIEGLNVYYFRNISNSLAWKRFFFAPGMIPKLRKEIKTFDILHMQEFRTFPNIIAHHYAKSYGIPYILHAHGTVETYFQRGGLKRIFDKLWGYRILADASKVIALTPVEAKQYRDAGVSNEKIEIVPNGIDLSEFKNLPARGEFRRRYGLNDNQKIILYLGRIYKLKGLDLLAKAFNGFTKELGNTKLIIAGPDDGYLSGLRKLIKELKIEEEVFFTGPLYGEEKLKAYVDADVYVLPSFHETFPVGVLEAWACGTPVIITDRCEVAHMINDQAGLVVPYNKDKLSDAILRVLSNSKMNQEFKEHGKTLVREQFNWQKITEKFEEIYGKMMKGEK